MVHYLQTYRPKEDDPLSVLTAREEDLQATGSSTTKKSKEKVVSFADICKIIIGDRLVFQTLTPHEMNMHSLGERIGRFATRPFAAPSLLEFMAVTKDLLMGRQPSESSEYSQRFYDRGGISPAAFRVFQSEGDDVVVKNERTHFVGDVMLMRTLLQMARAFNELGETTTFSIDFLGELSEARRTIEGEKGLTSVFHEDYRPIVLTVPYFDGHVLYPPVPVLLQPGDVVWNTNAEAIYFLNGFTVLDHKIGGKIAVPNRTFIKTTGNSCSATTLVGYGRNMQKILRCGRRGVFFGAK